MASELKVDTISEVTSANGVAIDGLTIKDGGITATTGTIVFNEASADVDFRVESNGNANMLFVNGGTNKVGVGIDDPTGTFHVKSTDAGTTMFIEDTHAGGGDGPELYLYRNSASPAANDDTGIINFLGKNDAGQDVNYVQIKSIIKDATDGQEDGKLELFHVLNGALTPSFQITPTEIVLNESSNDLDFRIESNGNTHMLFVDGGDNRVGIKSAPDLGGALHVKVSDSGGSVNGNYDTLVIEESGHSGIAILSGTSSAGLIGFGDSGAALRGYFSYNHSNDSIEIATAGAERMRIDGSGLIGMGNTTASSFNSGANKLVVGSGSGNNGLTIFAENNASSSIYFADGTSGDAAYRGYIQFNHSSDAMVIATSATQVASFHTDGIVFNENSNDQNFRVESNGNTNMIFVDAGSDFVGIGTNDSNSSTLNIAGATASNQLLVVDSTSASYGGDGVQRILCGRANTTAYEFMRIMSGGGSDNEFILRGDGNAYADNNWNSGGADYAEYFEWKDGNSSNEDRRGYPVILDGNKIVQATDSDDTSKIIGVISGNPAIVGDGAYTKWKDKYLKDDFGTYIREEYSVTEWVEIEEDGNNKNHSYETDKIPSDVTVPDSATVIMTEEDNVTKLTRRKINPSYDDTKNYVPRENRKEWDTVGLMGKLRLRKGQPIGTNWIKMRDISDTVEEWLIR